MVQHTLQAAAQANTPLSLKGAQKPLLTVCMIMPFLKKVFNLMFSKYIHKYSRSAILVFMLNINYDPPVKTNKQTTKSRILKLASQYQQTLTLH